MSDFTGKKIANTYKDLLKIDTSVDNEGINGTLRRIQDGSGTNTAISLSQNAAQVNGNLIVTGEISVNVFDVSVLNATEVSTTRLAATSITADKLDAGTLVFQDVSVSSLRTVNFLQQLLVLAR